jgi:hypothetical protein
MWNTFYGVVGNKRSFRDDQMNEMILLILAVVGVVSIICSITLIALGKMIDQFFPGDEAPRIRSLTGPVESTKIAVVLFWCMFFPAAWAVLQEGIITIILGITLLFAICLFMFTALLFSFGVLSAMSRGRERENGHTVEAVSTPPPDGGISSSGEPAGNPTPGKKPPPNGIVHTLLKK